MTTAAAVPAKPDQLCLESVRSFLFFEAELLDEWRLDEWFELFDTRARYTIAPLHESHRDPSKALALINDDHDRLRERVNHLLGGNAWAERPRSRTRRLMTNVQLLPGEGTLKLKANFVVYQFRHGESWEFVGTSHYELEPREMSYSILSRCIQLDHETMGQQRRISIIV